MLAGGATTLVFTRSHCGELLNEEADFAAGKAKSLASSKVFAATLDLVVGSCKEILIDDVPHPIVDQASFRPWSHAKQMIWNRAVRVAHVDMIRAFRSHQATTAIQLRPDVGRPFSCHWQALKSLHCRAVHTFYKLSLTNS